MDSGVFQDYTASSDDDYGESLVIPASSFKRDSDLDVTTDPTSSSSEIELTDIPRLVENFLAEVHTKNPFIDIDALRDRAQNIMHHGLDWTGWTCIVVGGLEKFISDGMTDDYPVG
jgi:hypothetical protein